MEISRREFLGTLAATAAGVGLAAAAGGYYAGLSSRPPTSVEDGGEPIRVGFQVHRTGLGSTYGAWYETTALAAADFINEMGGIDGRPLELMAKDDRTSPARGVELVEEFVLEDQVDFILGALFSNVVNSSAARAGELEVPYFAVSEGYHVPSGNLNRYSFQPGISDLRSQITAVAPWVIDNLGEKVAMLFPDYSFGQNHRRWFELAAREHGGELVEDGQVPVPPDRESNFSPYFSQIPDDVDVIYHVMVGRGILSFVREMGEHFGEDVPQLFGFIDSLEGLDLAQPGLEFLEGSYLWEGFPRYLDDYDTPYNRRYREEVGVDDAGRDLDNPSNVSTFSHMFSCWETLFTIKDVVEQSGYQERTPEDYRAFIETLENFDWLNEGIAHPQGPKKFVGELHQSFSQQWISRVENGRPHVVHKTEIDDSLYENDTDYTQRPL